MNSLKLLKIILKTKTVAPTTLPPATTQLRITTTKTTKTVTELNKSQKLFIHPLRHVGRQTTPQRNATMEPMQRIDHLPGKEDWKHGIKSKKEPTKLTRMKLLRLQPKI